MEKTKHLDMWQKDHKTIKTLAKSAGKTIRSFVSDLITVYKGNK